MRRPFLLIFLIGSLAMVGCGSARDEAKSVAQTFMNASAKHDTAGVQSVVTDKAQSFFTEGNGNSAFSQSADARFQIGEPRLDADTATVPVLITQEKATAETVLLMRREQERWKVYAEQIPTYPGGPQITLNFENPLAIIPDAMHAAGTVLGQVAKGMEQGASAFSRGFEEGYGKDHATPPPSPAVIREESPSPPVN